MIPLSLPRRAPEVSAPPIMAPRKKAAMNQPQVAVPAEFTNSLAAEIPVQSQPDTDLAGYPEVQQNEYLATEAIYPDGFLRLHGKKDAWKVSSLNSVNLALMSDTLRIKRILRSKYG